MKVDNLTADEKDQLGIRSGVIVRAVESGSAAADAGLQVNDVITRIVVRAKEINETIASVQDFSRVSQQLKDYSKAIAIHIRRDKGTQIIALTPKAK